MLWGTILYLSAGVVAVFSDILVSYDIPKGGGITGMGNIVFIYPAFALNMVWGFTFPFLLHSFVDPLLSPMIRWSILIGGAVLHSIVSTYSVFLFIKIGFMAQEYKSHKQ